MAVGTPNRYCTRIRSQRPNVPMEPDLIDILRCPVSHAPLRAMTADERDAINRAILAGHVRNGAGAAVAAALDAGLLTRDGRLAYRIDDGIPVMLADEAIAFDQIRDPSDR
jgi:uncharacterized protein YbaR (Trm112 family)